MVCVDVFWLSEIYRRNEIVDEILLEWNWNLRVFFHLNQKIN